MTDTSRPGGEAQPPADNRALVRKLHEYAELLDEQGANPFRARAYRKAADAVANLGEPVSAILKAGGRDALDALPNIGPRIAAALAELTATGRWSQLDRVRGQLQPESLFRTIPGVGPALAHRLAEELHLSSLEELEIAAHDGRLGLATGLVGALAGMVLLRGLLRDDILRTGVLLYGRWR